MSETNENQVMAEHAKAAVVANQRLHDVQGIPLTVGNDGQLVVMEKLLGILEVKQPNPFRRVGTALLKELSSFIGHVERYKEERTTIWADAASAVFCAVYNDHPAGDNQRETGWRDFRAQYNCPIAPEWKAWAARADDWMTQEVFAEWLDERMDDLTASVVDGMPTPVEVLEVARNLQIHTQGTFSKKIDPATGQFSMVCKEEHTQDSTKIPRAFMTALRIFDGGDQYGVEMRIRFRLQNGRPQFLYTVHRSAELQADAFGEMVDAVASATDRPVFAGLAGV